MNQAKKSSKVERLLDSKLLSLSQEALKEYLHQQEPKNKDQDRQVICTNNFFRRSILH
jgi:predicted transcriptional regulator